MDIVVFGNKSLLQRQRGNLRLGDRIYSEIVEFEVQIMFFQQGKGM